ncbi:MAG: type 1 glutamine amidotransferase domain-containing protein [Candidatus Omnitrophica bacterium]|nr:type 1 glutamine amidotransferase domain-containing protein [Candidatus Omnitrophota bacterium]
MQKNILAVLSEYGYWGEELVGPLEILDEAGYKTVFVTPKGKRAHALPPSMDAKYVDPPLGRTVVSEKMARKVKALDASKRLNDPLNLSKLFPERPYMSSRNYLRDFEEYNEKLEAAEKGIARYDALLLVGGSGPLIDMVNNQRVHDLILAFYKTGKSIAAECYGVACLAFARDYRIRKSIIRGKHVTGHPLEYDYKDGTGFLGVDFNMGPPPYPLEFILRDAVGAEGEFHGNVGRTVSALVDYPFITGRSTGDSYKTGELLVEVLKKGLKRYGW